MPPEECDLPSGCPLADPEAMRETERWRGEVTAKIDQLLSSRDTTERKADKVREDLDDLTTAHAATRGLAWRAIFISVGAWSAISLLAYFLFIHVGAK